MCVNMCLYDQYHIPLFQDILVILVQHFATMKYKCPRCDYNNKIYGDQMR